jgi:membrane-bound lytic murein transglycosylase A
MLYPQRIATIVGQSAFSFFRPFRALTAAALVAALADCMSAPPRVTPSVSPPSAGKGGLQPASWNDLAGWSQDDLSGAWPALQSGCTVLKRRAEWSRICAEGLMLDAGNPQAVRQFFESHFVPYRVVNSDGTDSGLVTGYYEPVLRGSKQRGGAYQVPLYAMPPQWRGKSLPARGELLQNPALRGRELVYVDDAVEAAFVQIQGSGRVQLAEGGVMRLGFGGTNEQPFRSFGKWLLDSGELRPAQGTMQGIKAWARANPGRVEEMLNVNPRYVFFRELPAGNDGPIGALGVPLTAERSIAVDPSTIPLGAPVFLSTTRPLSSQPIQRLMFAQDTGTAIRGAVRADFFWGAGDAAGEVAGRMKQSGQMWVLMPRG